MSDVEDMMFDYMYGRYAEEIEDLYKLQEQKDLDIERCYTAGLRGADWNPNAVSITLDSHHRRQCEKTWRSGAMIAWIEGRRSNRPRLLSFAEMLKREIKSQISDLNAAAFEVYDTPERRDRCVDPSLYVNRSKKDK